MKASLLAALFTILFMVSCTKENNNFSTTLNRKWKVHSIKILKLDDSFNQGACSYLTNASDFYGDPTIPSCQDDDIYDFTHPQNLTIYTGSKKCTFSDPASITKSYERKGDSLFIQSNPYHIVLLSQDTLILDYCTEYNN